MQTTSWHSIRRSLPLLLADAFLVFLSFLIALALRFEGRIPNEYRASFGSSVLLIIPLYCLVNYACGLYKHLWRYASAQEVVTILISTAASTAILIVASVLWRVQYPIPLSVVIVGGVFTSGAFTTIRYRKRLLTGLLGRLQRVVGSPARCRVLIIGAGEAGQLLAWQLKNRAIRREYELVGFVDDDPEKLGLKVHGATVLGDRQQIPALVAKRGVDLVIIAIHRVSGQDFRDILSLCQETKARIKVLPDLSDMMDNTNDSLLIRDITDADLLGREELQINQQASREIISDKVVLVTGACGSIGSELCRQITDFQPKLLLALDNNETGLYNLSLDLKLSPNPWVRYIIGDAVDTRRMEDLFQKYQPQLVFHAAAYKHVPLMEEHPREAVRVNVGSVRCLGQLSHQYRAERFVLISSDKAVEPCSVMGATKRLCEMMIANSEWQIADGRWQVTDEKPLAIGHQPSATLFTAVRFGNVLGSRGSVVPTFRKQIERGGAVTVTNSEATRYFMSLREAVSLIIQAASLTQGGDIFMLEMGEEIKIEDLARKMIRLRGLRVGADVEIKHVGLRRGEKLHERLIAADEEKHPTTCPHIFRVQNNGPIDRGWLLSQIEELMSLVEERENDRLVSKLWELVLERSEGIAGAGERGS